MHISRVGLDARRGLADARLHGSLVLTVNDLLLCSWSHQTQTSLKDTVTFSWNFDFKRVTPSGVGGNWPFATAMMPSSINTRPSMMHLALRIRDCASGSIDDNQRQIGNCEVEFTKGKQLSRIFLITFLFIAACSFSGIELHSSGAIRAADRRLSTSLTGLFQAELSKKRRHLTQIAPAAFGNSHRPKTYGPCICDCLARVLSAICHFLPGQGQSPD